MPGRTAHEISRLPQYTPHRHITGIRRRQPKEQHHKTLFLYNLGLLLLEEVVNDRVDEDAEDRNRRADLLLEGELLAEDNGDNDHDNDTLGRVGDRGGDRARL